MIAGDSRWDNQFLGRIATAYTWSFHKKATLIEWHDTRRWWGEVGNDGQYFRLRLSDNLPVAEVERTFWHEVGHLCLHPPPVRKANTGIDLRDCAEGLARKPDDAYLKSMQEFMQKREAAADAFMVREMERFRAEYGDLLRWAIIR